MYRSNWDLSAARAASVAHELLAAGVEPARLEVSGHADTQPRVANDTAEHRAQNRRVDITFIAGKDRHGEWARRRGRRATLRPLNPPLEPTASRARPGRGPEGSSPMPRDLCPCAAVISGRHPPSIFGAGVRC